MSLIHQYYRLLLLTYTEGYNKFTQLIGMTAGAGACARENKVFLLSDNTVLYHFLSTEENDWLHLIISKKVSIVKQ